MDNIVKVTDYIRVGIEKKGLPVHVIEYNEETVTKEGLKEDEIQL